MHGETVKIKPGGR